MAKPATPVQRPLLTDCITKLEQQQKFKNQGLLFQAAAEMYNRSARASGGIKEITPAIVRSRVDEWCLKIVTPKGKGGGEIDKALLIECINEVEKNGGHPNGQVAMYKAVEALYNTKAGFAGKPHTTFSVVGLRIKEWAIPIKTVSAKGNKGTMSEEDRQKVRERFAQARQNGGPVKRRKLKIDPDHLLHLKAYYPERFHKKCEAAAAGSLKAMVALECIQCMGFDINDVRKCTGRGKDKDGKPSFGCPLWPRRPYQNLQQIEPLASTGEDPDTESYDDVNEEEDSVETETAESFDLTAVGLEL